MVAHNENSIQAETPTDESGIRWNVEREAVISGTARYDDKVRDEVRWLWQYAQAEGWTMAYTATYLGCDTSTLSKFLRGEYRHPKTHTPMPPPTKVLSRIRGLKRHVDMQTSQANAGLVRTQTVERIWKLCDLTFAQGSIGFIFGDSHIGKTQALTWYRDEHNHGTTIYIRLSAVAGLQELYRLLGDALKLGEMPPAKLKRYVLGALDEHNLLIVDEFHQVTHCYLKGSSIRMVEAIREIHDVTRCATVLCATDVGKRELEHGKDAGLLKQIKRRGILELRLPPALPIADVRAFATAYGFDFPTSKRNERWSQMGDEEHLRICAELAYDHGVKRLLLTLQQACKYASSDARPVDWPDFVRAHRNFQALSITPEV